MINTVSAWLGMFYADVNNRIANGLRREEGQALAEYALILALVAVAVAGTLTLFKNQLVDTFNNVISSL
ncbi:MAG TPA: hypothetical protein VHB30_13020 [Solirubrobacteraceae bacterium]|jgi:pilus assembly protein Flp/PilA|nr:hypothetical protein [Solirubrobacteraceae bacterium]